MRRKTTFLLWLVWLAAAFGFPMLVRAAGPTASASGVPTPTPAANSPSPTPTPTGSTNIVINPSGSLQSLAMGMLKNVFKDLDATLENYLNQITRQLTNTLFNTPDGGIYSTAARPFTAIGIALFVAMAVLRLLWLQKNALAGGREDSLLTAAFDVVVAAVMVLGAGRLMDWLAVKTFALANVALGKIFVEGVLPQDWGSVINMASQSLGELFFMSFWLLGAILAIGSFAMAFVAIHGMFYILTALAPVVFTVGMLPPLGWMKRFWWFGLGAVILAPFVGAAALGALGMLISGNFGDLWLVNFFVRMIWIWGAAGMMWSLLFMLTRFTIGSVAGMAAKIVGGAMAVVSGLTAAGAVAAGSGLAGSGLGALGKSLGMGGVSGNGGGGANSSAPGGDNPYDAAAHHTALAGVAGAMSHAPLVGGAFRAAGMYHRTLANVSRLRGMAEAYDGRNRHYAPGDAKDVLTMAPHQLANEVFSTLAMPGTADYKTTLNEVQKRLGNVEFEDPEMGPINPMLWSESNGEPAVLAAGLALLYHQEPGLFEGTVDQNRWLEIKSKATNLVTAE